MADSSSEEKTEKPSAQKLRKAREEAFSQKELTLKDCAS